MSGASRTRLRPDAQVLVDYPDRVKVVLPTGAALEFDVPGSAVETAVALRTGEKGWSVAPDIMKSLEGRGLLVPLAMSDAELFVTGGLTNGLPARTGRVCVLGDGHVAKAAWRVLAEMEVPRARVVSGTRLEHLDAAADLLLVALDRLDLATLASVNAWCLASGTPWLPAGPFEPRRLDVGPLMVPHETACWSCFLARRRTNTSDRQVFDHLWGMNGQKTRRPDLLSSLLATIGHMAALEAARFLRGVVPATLECAWSLGIDRLDAAHDVVLRAPRCPDCSRLRKTPAREPWTLRMRGT